MPRLAVLLTMLLLHLGSAAGGQEQLLLGIPQGDAAAKNGRADEAVAAPTEDNPEATVAESSGTIAVGETVSDRQVEEKLQRLLPRYPGVRRVEIEVEDGVVTLTGHVEGDEIRDRLRDFARRVEGVNLVLNQTRTDAQVLSAWELAAKRLRAYGATLASRWLLGVLAVVIITLSILVARLFWKYDDWLLSPLSGNVLLRSVLGSVVGGLIILWGLFTALSLLGLTETVLPGLGLAGVVAIALSFAFRDIAENFIASILLGARQPFRVGDFIEVADRTGVVKALNTRATILMTLEGHQVRIPNAMVFKSIQTNRTAARSVRQTIDVMVPYAVSTIEAQEAIAGALRAHDGILNEPPARALVEALEPDGVRIRAYFWHPTRGVDVFKLLSDARLRIKVALQNADIHPPTQTLAVSITRPTSGGPESPDAGAEEALSAEPSSRLATESLTATRARDNLRRDTQAAATSTASSPDAQNDELKHVLDIAVDQSGAEGENLLQDGK